MQARVFQRQCDMAGQKEPVPQARHGQLSRVTEAMVYRYFGPLVMVAMVCVEMPPEGTVTVEVQAVGLQAPCRPAGYAEQDTILVPDTGVSLMVTVPAGTSIGGEQ